MRKTYICDGCDSNCKMMADMDDYVVDSFVTDLNKFCSSADFKEQDE